MLLVAIGCWLYVRQREFGERAKKHEETCIYWNFMASIHFGCGSQAKLREHQETQQAARAAVLTHQSLREKYEQAAKYPWLPVDADPPGIRFRDGYCLILNENGQTTRIRLDAMY